GTDPLSQPTWLASATNKNNATSRRFRLELLIPAAQSSSSAKAISSSLEPVAPPPTIAAYITGLSRLVIDGLATIVTSRLNVAVCPVGTTSGGCSRKAVLLGCWGELPP